MPRIKRINHIAIVVDNIDQALAFWRDTLGLELSHVEDVPDQEAVVAFLPTGESEVELVKPTNPNSGIARYLAKRGPGMHHICFEVEDLEGMLAHLKARGMHLINETPVIGTGGKKIAFIHPKSTHGVLVELYELTPEEPRRRLARLRVLLKRLRVESEVMRAAAQAFLRALRSPLPTNGDDRPENGSPEAP